MQRRNAIKSIIALATAPAIIKIEMLMPVKVIQESEFLFDFMGGYNCRSKTIFDVLQSQDEKFAQEFTVAYVEKMKKMMIKQSIDLAIHPDISTDLKFYLQNEQFLVYLTIVYG